MEITLTKTEEIVHVDGVSCRVWTGRTKAGVPITAYVHLLQVKAGDDTAEFERELLEMPAPKLWNHE